MRSFVVKVSIFASSPKLLGDDSLSHGCEVIDRLGEPKLEVVAGGVYRWDLNGVADARVSDE